MTVVRSHLVESRWRWREFVKRTILVSALLMLAVSSLSCGSCRTGAGSDGDTGTMADGRADIVTPEDASFDTADSLSDLKIQDPTDTGQDADTSVDPHKLCRERASGIVRDFHVVGQNRVVNAVRGDKSGAPHVSKEGQRPCGAFALLDTEQADSIQTLDTRTYPESIVHVEQVDDQIVVVAMKYDFRKGPSFWRPRAAMKNMIAETFEIRDNELHRTSHHENLVTPPLSEDYPSFVPLALVSNRDTLLVIGRSLLYFLGFDDSGRVVLEDEYDRSEFVQELGSQLEDRSYSPSKYAQYLTDDGYLLEFEQGISVWDISAIRSAANGSDPVIDYLKISSLSGVPWAYSSDASIAYLAGDRAPFQADQEPVVHVVDVSDRRNPTEVATWEPQAFSLEPTYFTNISPPGMFGARNGRLSMLHSHESDLVLTVFDIGEQPTTPDEIAARRTLGQGSDAQYVWAVYPDDERLYYSYAVSSELNYRLGWVAFSDL